MMRLWVLLFLGVLTDVVPVTAQIFGPINRANTHKKRADLGRRLSIARPDSNKVILLLDISNAYLKANAPDSALFYSDQAFNLSQSLGMQEEQQQGRFLACRAYAMMGVIAAAETIAANTKGIWKMRMLQELSEHYSLRPGNLSSNLDTAWRYIRQLVALTDTMHSVAATRNTRAVLGKYYYERGDLRKGMDFFQQNIRECQQIGDQEQEAHWWSELGIYTPGYAETIDIILQAMTKAQQLFELSGNRKEALYALTDIAEWHWLMGRPGLAEKEGRLRRISGHS